MTFAAVFAWHWVNSCMFAKWWMSPTRLSSLYFDLHFDISFYFLRTVWLCQLLFLHSFIFAVSYFPLLFCHDQHQVNSLCSGQSNVVMRWPTVPCLCFRAPTTYRHPNLEGEQVEQQTTALHQSLWRWRWAEGRFVKALKFGAHLEYFFIVRF